MVNIIYYSFNDIISIINKTISVDILSNKKIIDSKLQLKDTQIKKINAIKNLNKNHIDYSIIDNLLVLFILSDKSTFPYNKYKSLDPLNYDLSLGSPNSDVINNLNLHTTPPFKNALNQNELHILDSNYVNVKETPTFNLNYDLCDKIQPLNLTKSIDLDSTLIYLCEFYNYLLSLIGSSARIEDNLDYYEYYIENNMSLFGKFIASNFKEIDLDNIDKATLLFIYFASIKLEINPFNSSIAKFINCQNNLLYVFIAKAFSILENKLSNPSLNPSLEYMSLTNTYAQYSINNFCSLLDIDKDNMSALDKTFLNIIYKFNSDKNIKDITSGTPNNFKIYKFFDSLLKSNNLYINRPVISSIDDLKVKVNSMCKNSTFFSYLMKKYPPKNKRDYIYFYILFIFFENEKDLWTNYLNMINTGEYVKYIDNYDYILYMNFVDSKKEHLLRAILMNSFKLDEDIKSINIENIINSHFNQLCKLNPEINKDTINKSTLSFLDKSFLIVINKYITSLTNESNSLDSLLNKIFKEVDLCLVNTNNFTYNEKILYKTATHIIGELIETFDMIEYSKLARTYLNSNIFYNKNLEPDLNIFNTIIFPTNSKEYLYCVFLYVYSLKYNCTTNVTNFSNELTISLLSNYLKSIQI